MEVDYGSQDLTDYQSDAQGILNAIALKKPPTYFLERALSILHTYQQIPNSVAQETTLIDIMARAAVAMYYIAQPHGYWNDILTIWSRFYSNCSSLDDADVRTELLTQLATIRHNQGDLDGALALYSEIVQQPDFPTLSAIRKANALHDRGICFRKNGQGREARKMFRECLRIADEELHRDHMYANSGLVPSAEARSLHYVRLHALHQLGNLNIFNGRFRRARRAYLEVLKGYEAIGESDGLASIELYSLGRLAVIQRRHAEAIPYLESALASRRRRHDVDGVASIASWLAAAYTGTAQHCDAEILLNEATTTFRSINNQDGLLFCHLFSGILAKKRGDLDEALIQQRQVQKTLSSASSSARLLTTYVYSRELLANHDFVNLVRFVFGIAASALRQKTGLSYKALINTPSL